MPAYPNPMPDVPILREGLPPQPDRPFPGMLWLVFVFTASFSV
jgi:hypothetical protein